MDFSDGGSTFRAYWAFSRTGNRLRASFLESGLVAGLKNLTISFFLRKVSFYRKRHLVYHLLALIRVLGVYNGGIPLARINFSLWTCFEAKFSNFCGFSTQLFHKRKHMFRHTFQLSNVFSTVWDSLFINNNHQKQRTIEHNSITWKINTKTIEPIY